MAGEDFIIAHLVQSIEDVADNLLICRLLGVFFAEVEAVFIFFIVFLEPEEHLPFVAADRV